MRRRARAVGFGLVVVIAGALLPATHAGAQVAVTCGMEVTTSIRLRADLHCAGDALVVAADGVTIDLNDHTLSGDGSGTGIVLRCGDFECAGRSFEVEDGTVSGFAAGIDASGGTATVDRVVFEGNDVGIVAGRRIPLSVGTELTVSRSEFRGNGTGIAAVFGNAVVRRTDFIANGTGIGTFGPHTLTLDRADFTANETGVFLFRSSATITDSRFTDNTGAGVSASGGPAFAAVSITDSKLRGNGTGVFRGANVDLTLRRNDFVENDSAVFVAPGTPGAFVATENRFRSNRNWGLFLENTFPAGSLIADTRFVRNDGGGLHLLGAEGPEGRLPSGVTVRDNVANGNDGIGIEAPLSIDGGGNRARNNAAPQQCVGVVCG